MYKLSDILSKPVVNLYSGKYEGTVKNISFDEKFKQAKWLILFDEEGEEFALDINKIYIIGKNAVTVKNEDGIFKLNSIDGILNNNPINLSCCTVYGEVLGRLSDIEFNKNFYVESFCVEDKTYNANKIINIGQEFVIVNDTDKKITISNFKPKFEIKKESPVSIVTIQPVETIENTLPKIESVESVETKKPFIINEGINQQRIISNQNFLLGRKATKTIYGINNEIIVKKDNTINSKNLEYAKLHNKISELAVFSKTRI